MMIWAFIGTIIFQFEMMICHYLFLLCFIDSLEFAALSYKMTEHLYLVIPGSDVENKALARRKTFIF